MKRNMILAAALAAGSLMGLATTAQAIPAVVAGTEGIVIQSAPPPPIYEAVPVARPGYVWAPGYYSWSGDRYVWNGGRWMETRRGYAYVEPRWVRRGDGSWYMRDGAWVRSDRYSYLDRHDLRDDHLRAEGGPWGDADHDGVPNRYDRFPLDPYRS